jgi:hypothetical protein
MPLMAELFGTVNVSNGSFSSLGSIGSMSHSSYGNTTTTTSCTLVTLAHWNFANANQKCSQGIQPLDGSGISPSSTHDMNCNSVNVSNITNGDGSSCVKGVFQSPEAAICVTASSEDYFKNNDDDAAMFTVEFGAADKGRLTEVSFYERVRKHNENFGENNYARKFGIRVLKNGTEIYKETDISTTLNDWKEHTFDFSNDSGFEYNGATTFKFEILGYDPANIWGDQASELWEIDELSVKGCGGDIELEEELSVSCMQIITIVDNTPPTLTGVPDDLNFKCFEDVPVEDPTIVIADDNCSYVVEFKADTTGVYPCDFIITRKWKVTDECDNMVMESQKIIVKDDVPPTTCDPDNKEIECEGAIANKLVADNWNSDNITKLELFSSDLCGDVHVTSNYDYSNLHPACGETGTLTVVYTITDDCENYVTREVTFIIVDTTKPETCDPDNKEFEQQFSARR